MISQPRAAQILEMIRELGMSHKTREEFFGQDEGTIGEPTGKEIFGLTIIRGEKGEIEFESAT